MLALIIGLTLLPAILIPTSYIGAGGWSVFGLLLAIANILIGLHELKEKHEKTLSI